MIATGYYPTCKDMYDAALQAKMDLIQRDSEFKQNQNRHVTTQIAKLLGPPHTTFKRRGTSFSSTYIANKSKTCDHCYRVHLGGRVELASVVDSLGIK
ncbi:hypothetical protein ACH5RR_037290 [Cinchona calisaya]|uniref:Uncharacterized protein n=1 Tax=Cinchona calisaya TaxID=153742 RepID=A0ABD2Y800_9GENT